MGKRFGKADFKQLKDLHKKFEKLDGKQIIEFYEAAAKELAARLLGLVIPRTAVGQYSSGSGKVGGTLRRGWTNEKDIDFKSYAESLSVTSTGSSFVIEIINPVDYASYVEFGHRTPNHKGWVAGQFMLTISEEELQAATPQILEKMIVGMFKDVFG
ncbi:HK97 gp10 family phage protein [Mycobacteroides abscessus]|uniref:HK97 gp10 family phage protein n=1 Tax=unclassified Desemzia TaxID=2685243 RepID=UPI0009A7AD2E